MTDSWSLQLPATIAVNQAICSVIVQTTTVEHVTTVERLDIFREIVQKDQRILAYAIVVEKQAIYLVTVQWGKKNMKVLQPATGSYDTRKVFRFLHTNF